MSNAVLCDRCGDATDQVQHNHGLRSAVHIAHLSNAATMNTRASLDLCEDCTESLHQWLDRDLPNEYVEKREGEE